MTQDHDTWASQSHAVGPRPPAVGLCCLAPATATAKAFLSGKSTWPLPSLECRLGVEGRTRAQGVEAAGLCSGLNGGPQTFVQVRIPGTCDMTLFEKRIFADVI